MGLAGELERSDVSFQVRLRDTSPRQPKGIVESAAKSRLSY